MQSCYMQTNAHAVSANAAMQEKMLCRSSASLSEISGLSVRRWECIADWKWDVAGLFWRKYKKKINGSAERCSEKQK